MKRTAFLLTFLAYSGMSILCGCATHTPTTAHTHIGHAMAGWPDTPNQEGLFVAAENAAQSALQAAENATNKQNGLPEIRQDVSRVIRYTNPEEDLDQEEEDGKQYGVKNALTGAVHHITYAAQSPDASANVKSFAPEFATDASFVLDRCDLITALGNDILQASSENEADVLSGELLKLVRTNVYGNDSNGDGVTGSSPKEYGLKQLRAKLEAMIDREDPPYETVDTWYLFNLVRLPSGEWIFRQLSSPGSGKKYGGY